MWNQEILVAVITLFNDDSFVANNNLYPRFPFQGRTKKSLSPFSLSKSSSMGSIWGFKAQKARG